MAGHRATEENPLPPFFDGNDFAALEYLTVGLSP
jgi:hypothetical protein